MSGPAEPAASREEPLSSTFPQAALVLVGAAAAIFALVGLRQLDWLVGPVFLALVMVLLVHPLHEWLRRHHVPAAAALLILLLAIYGLILAIVAIVVISLARLARLIPTYAAELGVLVRGIRDQLAAVGVGPEQARALTATIDPSGAVAVLTSVLSQSVSLGASVVFLLSLLLFMGVDATGVGSRMASLRAQRPQLAAALRSFADNTRRFLGVTTIFGLLTGLADALLLLWLGIPLALLWGLLAVVSNYIPYVGFVIGVIPPALLALLIGGWDLMTFVIVAYIVLNSLLTSLIQPYFMGNAVGVSTTVTIVALVLWGWVLGPLGAILAIPLTLLCKAVLVDADPRATWVNALIGSSKPGQARPSLLATLWKRRRNTSGRLPAASATVSPVPKPGAERPDEPHHNDG